MEINIRTYQDLVRNDKKCTDTDYIRFACNHIVDIPNQNPLKPYLVVMHDMTDQEITEYLQHALVDDLGMTKRRK